MTKSAVGSSGLRPRTDRESKVATMPPSASVHAMYLEASADWIWDFYQMLNFLVHYFEVYMKLVAGSLWHLAATQLNCGRV
jgi:hypothetical protein